MMKPLLLINVLFFLLFPAGTTAQLPFHFQPGFDQEHNLSKDSVIHAVNSETFFHSPHKLPVSDHESLFEGIPTNNNHANDWKVFLILAGLASIAFARYFFGSRIRHFFRAAFAENFFNQMERDGGFFNETVTYLLYFNFLIVFSLFIWQTLTFFEVSPSFEIHGSLLLFFFTLLLLSVFAITKSLCLGFLSWVFKTQQATTAYLKNIFLFNQLIGLILLPVVIYLSYQPSSFGMIFTWSFWVIANLAKVIRGITIARNNTPFSVYYLILYLCSVELVPLSLAIKLGSIHLTTP